MGSKRRTLWLVVGVVLLVGAGVAVLAKPPRTADGITPDNSVAAPALAGSSAATPLQIVVIGGTKGIGRAVVDLAAERGHTVTAVARRAPEIPFASSSVVFMQGDVTNAAAVKRVVAGQDAIVTAVAAAPSRKPITVFSTGMTNVLAGLDATQSQRLIAVTGIGAGDSRGHGGWLYDEVLWPLLLRTAYEDKDREEALIRAGSTPWTIVRPGFLTNDAATGDYAVVTRIDGVRAGSISRRDVAHFIVGAIESGAFVHDTVLLTRSR